MSLHVCISITLLLLIMITLSQRDMNYLVMRYALCANGSVRCGITSWDHTHISVLLRYNL